MGPADLLQSARLLYPDFKFRLIRAIRRFEEHQEFRVRITMGVRSFRKQQELYDQGRKTEGKIVTKAKPGYTMHNYGIAADICTTVVADPYLEKDPNGEKKWERWGECVEDEGLVWGGRWPELVDRPHAEITYGMKAEEMLHLFQDGGIPAVWEAFDNRRGVAERSVWGQVLNELRISGFEI